MKNIREIVNRTFKKISRGFLTLAAAGLIMTAVACEKPPIRGTIVKRKYVSPEALNLRGYAQCVITLKDDENRIHQIPYYGSSGAMSSLEEIFKPSLRIEVARNRGLDSRSRPYIFPRILP